MTKPSRKVGAHVRWLPRADHRTLERYSATEIESLKNGGEWSIWADHPQPGKVWLVRVNDDGETCFASADLNDLDLVVR